MHLYCQICGEFPFGEARGVLVCWECAARFATIEAMRLDEPGRILDCIGVGCLAARPCPYCTWIRIIALLSAEEWAALQEEHAALLGQGQ